MILFSLQLSLQAILFLLEKRISRFISLQSIVFMGKIICNERSTFIPTAKIKEQCLQHYSHLVIYLHNYIST